MAGLVFRGRFRSRVLLSIVLCIVLFFYLDSLMGFLKSSASIFSSEEKSKKSPEEAIVADVADQSHKIQSELFNLDSVLTEHIQKARHNPGMNNKNPQWRKEIEEINQILSDAQKRLHHALADKSDSPEPINDIKANAPILEAAQQKTEPSKSDSEKDKSEVAKPEISPYDHTCGDPTDPDVKAKRDKVKGMMQHAWYGYKAKAWTENEVRPISGKGHSASIFGNAKTGATIVDALDTLWIMGLKDEFNEGREWVKSGFQFNSNTDVSVFETVIRFVGGFISAGTMSGDPMFYEKAVEIVELLQGAFETPSGIPMALFNPTTKRKKNWNWASSGCSILSEIGTLHLEYSELSNYTKNDKYLKSVLNIRDILKSMDRPDKLYPNYINPTTGKWGQKHVSVGGLGDSFYEYLIKTYVYTNKEDNTALVMYKDAWEGIEKALIKKSTGGLTYIGEYKSGRTTATMSHLTCFAGGMIALAANSDPTISTIEKNRQMELAAQITNSCHESYDRATSKLGPESFRFDLTDDKEATQTRSQDAYYILRPEVIESYFYMWRYTKDQRYRDWAWAAIEALEKHCKAAWGYTGLKNVYADPPTKDDLQQSFFLAETLKYLYLIFSEDNLISLDEFVFNTEAHPIRIRK